MSASPVPPRAAPSPAPARKPFTLSLQRHKGRKKGDKKPDAAFMAALHRALPYGAGMGAYWHQEILLGRAAWPPVPTATPPRRCGRRGDRGRLYPFYYVHRPEAPPAADAPRDRLALAPAPALAAELPRRYAANAGEGERVVSAKPAARPRRARAASSSCCFECHQDAWQRDRQRFRAFEALDGAPDPVAAVVDAMEDGATPPGDVSPSAAVIEQLADVGGAVRELKLEPEDLDSLRAQIGRYLSGERVVTIWPFAPRPPAG